MPALILRNADVGLDVRSPEWVADLTSFRRWADVDSLGHPEFTVEVR